MNNNIFGLISLFLPDNVSVNLNVKNLRAVVKTIQTEKKKTHAREKHLSQLSEGVMGALVCLLIQADYTCSNKLFLLRNG